MAWDSGKFSDCVCMRGAFSAGLEATTLRQTGCLPPRGTVSQPPGKPSVSTQVGKRATCLEFSDLSAGCISGKKMEAKNVFASIFLPANPNAGKHAANGARLTVVSERFPMRGLLSAGLPVLRSSYCGGWRSPGSTADRMSAATATAPNSPPFPVPPSTRQLKPRSSPVSSR